MTNSSSKWKVGINFVSEARSQITRPKKMPSSSWIPTALALVSASVLAGAAYAANSGAFTRIEFEERKLKKGRKFMVKGHRGEYRGAGKHFKALPGKAKQVVGLYWDDPNIVGKMRCRYSVGVVAGSSPDLDDRIKTMDGFTQIELLSDIPVLYTKFPYTGTLSIIIGAIRVFPAWVEETRRKHVSHGPIVEITSCDEGFTEYFFLMGPPPPELAVLMNGL